MRQQRTGGSQLVATAKPGGSRSCATASNVPSSFKYFVRSRIASLAIPGAAGSQGGQYPIDTEAPFLSSISLTSGRDVNSADASDRRQYRTHGGGLTGVTLMRKKRLGGHFASGSTFGVSWQF